jgi:exonuclease III
LALRPHMSPTGPAPEHFRVATWNVNTLRARAGPLCRFLGRTLTDVLCLQETKATKVADAAAADLFERFGDTVVHRGDGGYNGVTIASLHPVAAEMASGDFGNGDLDREPRLISCVVDVGRPVRVDHGLAGDQLYELVGVSKRAGTRGDAEDMCPAC